MTGEAFGPYRLESLLGRGGMGEVWRAVDTSHGNRVVAVKVLGSRFDGDGVFAARFRGEAELAASLSGPHIVPIHSYGEIDGRLYIEMALIEGTDLAALLAAHGPLAAERAIAIIDQVADALDTAHRAGLVHRDVKPSNVLVTARDHAYLIDFGIARALDGTRYTITGTVVGTPAYLAPERFDGAGDHRGDVYALGCMLHEALTGRPPFTAEGMHALCKAHSTAPRPRPSELRPGLPPGLDQVVATAMHPDPERRYPSTANLAAAARAALGVPVGEGPRPVPMTVAPGRMDAGAVAPPRTQPIPPWEASMPFSPGPAPAEAAQAGWWRRWRRPGPSAAVAEAVGLAWPGTAVERGLTGHTDQVLAVTTAQLNGRPVVIAGGRDEKLRIWNLATGDRIGLPLTGHFRAVRAVTTTKLDDRPIIISGSADTTLRVWDLATGDALGKHLHSRRGVRAVTAAQVDGRPVIISGSDDPTLLVHELAKSRFDGIFDGILKGHTGAVSAVTSAELDGRPVIVSGGADYTVRVWDLATGDHIGHPLTGHGIVYAVTAAQLDGRPVILAGGTHRTLRVWDLATGDPIATLTGHTRAVHAVTTAELNGHPVVVSGGADHSLRVWDLATGDPIATLTGHSGAVHAVTATELDGRPVVISGGDDDTVRVWDLIARTST